MRTRAIRQVAVQCQLDRIDLSVSLGSVVARAVRSSRVGPDEIVAHGEGASMDEALNMMMMTMPQ